MQTLVIVWQRLLNLGQTCDRCAATELALQQAVETLQQALAPLQMQVVLHRQPLSLEQFNQDPGASNRIWIADRPLEAWLGASTGSSPCCSVCGDAACRTLECGNRSYEANTPAVDHQSRITGGRTADVGALTRPLSRGDGNMEYAVSGIASMLLFASFLLKTVPLEPELAYQLISSTFRFSSPTTLDCCSVAVATCSSSPARPNTP